MTLCLEVALTLTVNRHCDCLIHLESHWDLVRSLAALSVLFMVRPADSFLVLEDAVSCHDQVRPSTAHLIARIDCLARVAIMLGIEYAWNVFPSTPISSSILLLANAMLLGGIWFGFADGRTPFRPSVVSHRSDKHS
jgi:hypothetical protein